MIQKNINNYYYERVRERLHKKKHIQLKVAEKMFFCEVYFKRGDIRPFNSFEKVCVSLVKK